MRLHVLGSGSKGNCSLVQSGSTLVMVDCGISKKALLARCRELGVDPSEISAVLVTHEHNDHVKGLGVCLRGLRMEGEMPIYLTSGTRSANDYLSRYPNATHVKPGEGFSLRDLHVDVFGTSHDALSPIGFRFTDESTGQSIGYITDSGICLPEASEMLADCDLLAVEANHDPEMLAHGPYPAYLKSRIASELGHLSNEQARDLLGVIATDRLQAVVGMHLSEQNNDPAVAARALEDAVHLQGIGAKVLVSRQNHPISCETSSI